MVENLRGGYGFSLEAKQYARDRANNHCEFGDGTCPRPNTGRVNHLTGCFEGRLIGMRPEDLSDPKMNAVMMCELHEMQHDANEQFQVECLNYERRIDRGNRRRTKFISRQDFNKTRR